MENQKNDNLNLLEAVVQNTEMGKNTLEQIVPMTEEPRFKAELLRQRNIYRELNQEARTAITACGGTAQGQSTMAKLNTKMGISMKTLTDKSTRNLAEMLSEGSSHSCMSPTIKRMKQTHCFLLIIRWTRFNNRTYQNFQKSAAYCINHYRSQYPYKWYRYHFR